MDRRRGFRAVYITAGCVVTRDPDSGVRNVGTYRVEIKDHPVQPRTVMFAAWAYAPQFGKSTVVVDDDIDVRDPDDVNWALSFRVQPENDTFIVSGTAEVLLDPSQEKSSGRVSSKLGIDATRKHKFPPLALPPREHLARVRQDWKKYGFQD